MLRALSASACRAVPSACSFSPAAAPRSSTSSSGFTSCNWSSAPRRSRWRCCCPASWAAWRSAAPAAAVGAGDGPSAARGRGSRSGHRRDRPPDAAGAALRAAGVRGLAGYGYASVLLRALVCALVLLPPTMLMGATLPAISRWPASSARRAHRRSGLLYMANIAGGAFGTVLAGFYLLRVYDTVIAGVRGGRHQRPRGRSRAWWHGRASPHSVSSHPAPRGTIDGTRRRRYPGSACDPSIWSRRCRASRPSAPKSCGRGSCRCSSARASTSSR